MVRARFPPRADDDHGKIGEGYLGSSARTASATSHVQCRVLFSGASDLAFRGPYLQLGMWQEIQKELKELPAPRELQGRPPFSWQFEANTFRILGLNLANTNGKFALLVRREASSLDNAKQVDEENHLLIRVLTKEYPDISEVFEAIAVDATEVGSRKALRTVEETRKSP